jgi:hypothetical protein
MRFADEMDQHHEHRAALQTDAALMQCRTQARCRQTFEPRESMMKDEEQNDDDGNRHPKQP